MKLAIVQCDCGNPEPHRRFRTEEGRETKSFFSLIHGRRMHTKILAQGDVQQTDAERAATEQELASCGLPEEDPALPPRARPLPLMRPPLSEDELRVFAETLKVYPVAEHKTMIEVASFFGLFTAEEGEKILALAAK